MRKAQPADNPAMPDGLSPMLHAQAAILLTAISRLDALHSTELLARARGHLDQVPAEMTDQLQVPRGLPGLEQLTEGNDEPEDGAAETITDPDNDS